VRHHLLLPLAVLWLVHGQHVAAAVLIAGWAVADATLQQWED
jgi:hypothetical protein